MRFFVGLFMIAGLMASSPAMAQEENIDTSRSWGSAICSSKMPCEDLMSLTPDMPQFITIFNNATNCLSRRLAYRSEKGEPVFNVTRGINARLCLTAERSKNSFAPECCFQKTPDGNQCYLRCLLRAKK